MRFEQTYNGSDVWLSRLNLPGVSDCIQNHASGTRSLISSSSYLVSARAQAFNPRVGKGDFHSKKFHLREIEYVASRYIALPVCMNSGALYCRHFFFSCPIKSHAAAFCKPSWRTNADVTLLCGVPPMVGVTSGGGAEHRKPIVASTRPNHLRFCGQAIHVPSSFSQYSLTAHLDRDEPGYRLLLACNSRDRTRHS